MQAVMTAWVLHCCSECARGCSSPEDISPFLRVVEARQTQNEDLSRSTHIWTGRTRSECVALDQVADEGGFCWRGRLTKATLSAPAGLLRVVEKNQHVHAKPLVSRKLWRVRERLALNEGYLLASKQEVGR